MRWALGLVLACAACGGGDDDGGMPVAAQCDTEPVDPGVLHTDGTLIRDSHDRVITLRGVNAGGRSKFPPYSPFEYEDGAFDAALATYLDRPKTWGFDVLRVPFSWNAAEPTEGTWDEEYLARYDALLDAAHARGMWTIVDFHQDIYAEALCGDGFPDWTLDDPPEPHRDCENWARAYTTAPVQDAFDAFWFDTGGVRTQFGAMWDMMVDRHADRPGVIGFEIINEPSEGSTRLSEWETDVLSPFFTEYVARVQARDSDALVFIDAGGVAGVALATDMTRPEGDNIVFAPHYYQPGALFDGAVVQNVFEQLTRWDEKGAEWDVPVLLGEFGVVGTHIDAGAYMGWHYDAFEQLQMHATVWEYSESPELWNFEDLSLLTPDGIENAAVLDEIVRPYPRAVAGELIAYAFDSQTGVFDLEYVPAAEGITEVVLPEALYGEVRITGEGVCVDRDGDRLWIGVDSAAGVARVRVEHAE